MSACEMLNVVGDQIRVLADSKSTGGRCFMFECVTQPNAGPPLHRHERDDEIFYIVEGTMKFMIDGQTLIRQAGDTITAKRGTIHTFCNIGERPAKMIITCTPGGLDECFRRTHVLCTEGRATPEALAAAFADFELTFHGPPLAALELATA